MSYNAKNNNKNAKYVYFFMKNFPYFLKRNELSLVCHRSALEKKICVAILYEAFFYKRKNVVNTKKGPFYEKKKQWSVELENISTTISVGVRVVFTLSLLFLNVFESQMFKRLAKHRYPKSHSNPNNGC